MKTLERFKADNPNVFQTWKDNVRDSQQKAKAAAEAAMAESQRLLLREQMATESELMNFQFDGTADDQSKDVALLRAAVRLATPTAALISAQNNDRQLQFQLTATYKSDFNMWKKRKACDVWTEIVATKCTLDDLVEEYEDLAVADDADDDYVPESNISESDVSMEDIDDDEEDF
ncbi:hypothetical protein NU219Hw_g8732t1 [Hortaea werneckii]